MPNGEARSPRRLGLPPAGGARSLSATPRASGAGSDPGLMLQGATPPSAAPTPRAGGGPSLLPNIGPASVPLTAGPLLTPRRGARLEHAIHNGVAPSLQTFVRDALRRIVTLGEGSGGSASGSGLSTAGRAVTIRTVAAAGTGATVFRHTPSPRTHVADTRDRPRRRHVSLPASIRAAVDEPVKPTSLDPHFNRQPTVFDQSCSVVANAVPAFYKELAIPEAEALLPNVSRRMDELAMPVKRRSRKAPCHRFDPNEASKAITAEADAKRLLSEGHTREQRREQDQAAAVAAAAAREAQVKAALAAFDGEVVPTHVSPPTAARRCVSPDASGLTVSVGRSRAAVTALQNPLRAKQRHTAKRLFQHQQQQQQLVPSLSHTVSEVWGDDSTALASSSRHPAAPNMIGGDATPAGAFGNQLPATSLLLPQSPPHLSPSHANFEGGDAFSRSAMSTASHRSETVGDSPGSKPPGGLSHTRSTVRVSPARSTGGDSSVPALSPSLQDRKMSVLNVPGVFSPLSSP